MVEIAGIPWTPYLFLRLGVKTPLNLARYAQDSSIGIVILLTIRSM
jgi:hypothetical protein